MMSRCILLHLYTMHTHHYEDTHYYEDKLFSLPQGGGGVQGQNSSAKCNRYGMASLQDSQQIVPSRKTLFWPGHGGRQQQRQQQGRWTLCGEDQGSAQWCTVDKGTRPQVKQGSTLPPSGHLQRHTMTTTHANMDNSNHFHTQLISALLEMTCDGYLK